MDISKLSGKIPDSVIAQIPTVMEKFGISTPLRLAHFLAQCAHESGNFRYLQENLNYPASSLTRSWPSLFPASIAESYAMKPEKIADRAYGNRMGNGTEASGDGWKYHGRGYIQLTGKANYTDFAKYIGEDTVSNPDLVATKYPLASAAFFFTKNGIWTVCDRGADDATIAEVTRRVNGGYNGLAERTANFKAFYPLLAQ